MDLTTTIGSKTFCTVGSHPDCDVKCVFQAIEEPIHIKFEAKGDHSSGRPLDSPGHLYITDIDSGIELMVDGEALPKGEQKEVRPGSTVAFGDKAVYKVMRNSFAHA